MKKIVIIVEILFMLCIYTSCKDENKNAQLPGQVSNIQAIPGPGQIMFSWTNPSDEDFYYVNISYTDSKGNLKNFKVSRFAEDTIIPLAHSIDSVLITGFADTKEYTFEFTAINTAGNGSAPVYFKATPLTPAFAEVINTVQMVPDFGGAVITWTNTTGQEITVQLKYQDNDGSYKLSAFNSADENGTGIISGLNSNERIFEVTTLDKDNNSSAPIDFTITPYSEVQISNTGWQVIDYDCDIDEGGGAGLVKNVIDGNYTTYWHTNYNPIIPYPHFVTVDMGRVVTISRFVVYRRQGNNNIASSISFLTSIDGVNWVDDGINYTSNSASDDGYSNRVVSNPKARYFKYIGLESSTSNQYMCTAEIEIYGADSE